MIIEFLNGQQIDLEKQYNCKLLKPFVPSVSRSPSFQSVDGRAPILTSVDKKERSLRADFMIKTYDVIDFYLLRDELNELFFREETFYIINKKLPFKRWLVTMADNIDIVGEYARLNKFSINFICVNEYAESIGTSLALHSNKEWDVDLWGWGMGLDWDKDYKYIHSANNFIINNIGNIPIDPRVHEIEITIKATAASYLQIKNNTTGDVYRYNGALTAIDTLVINGIRTLKNGVSVFKDTNKRLITLAKGENNITVEGGTLTSIAFDFKFLYM
ncbi:phage tail domain-containing protein [Metasolibacillus sp.]|uniref:phage tail domain-containing protein n=1 Tax=Metasolibacillus sp. TaxID=2703680 RepID=UPI0025E74528|nr:phage tail domain-containing protein [Metasolibacillus sp.]MCT6925405.1 phage tail family protein [Metasolibacillus sp.]MCT6941568.1 phage tail family protein [Metasolibacillus sp.]